MPPPWTFPATDSAVRLRSTCFITSRPRQPQDLVFAELARVLVPGGVFVAADGIENEASRQFHTDDVYNPIDPGSLDLRLTRNGFTSVDVRVYDIGWICTARRPE
jgi:hypothetical protein